MRIVEYATVGKMGPHTCEDIVVVTDDYAAVVDGATDPAGVFYGEVTGGWLAAAACAQAIRSWSPDIDAFTAAESLTSAVSYAISSSPSPTVVGPWGPRAVTAVYSAHHKQVWRIGDVNLRIGEAVVPPLRTDINILVALRHLYTEALLASGASLSDIVSNDPGMAAAVEVEKHWQVFVNHPTSVHRHAAVNGTPIPQNLVEVFDVGTADEVVIATDGHIHLMGTLADAERVLAVALAADPAGVDPYSGVSRSVRPGWVSFDDRAWIRLQP